MLANQESFLYLLVQFTIHRPWMRSNTSHQNQLQLVVLEFKWHYMQTVEKPKEGSKIRNTQPYRKRKITTLKTTFISKNTYQFSDKRTDTSYMRRQLPLFQGMQGILPERKSKYKNFYKSDCNRPVF